MYPIDSTLKVLYCHEVDLRNMEAMSSGLGWAGWAGLVAGLVLVAIIR